MTVVTHLTVLDQSEENIVGVRLQGKLRPEDLRNLGRELAERSAQHGRLGLLLELKSIKSHTPNELWEDMRLACSQIAEVERLALVSDDEDYRRWLAALSTSLIEGEVRYFEAGDLRNAWHYAKGDSEISPINEGTEEAS
jgi:hypothetical protein